jgi:gamma-glutamyl-gamma-aminobutyrate hydrolase PuuD
MKDKKKNKLPILNISWASKYSEDELILQFLSTKYNVNVLDINNLKMNPDIVIYSGGEDINPKYYNESLSAKTGKLNVDRDSIEYNTFRKFRHLPSLGICRGAQFLTSMNGGKIIQHVENHNFSHKITTYDEGMPWSEEYEFIIPSTHHQMMNPYNLNKNAYKLLAWSTNFKSPTYIGGDNREIELDPAFLEPEIVFYNNYKIN